MKKRRRAFKRWEPKHTVSIFFYDSARIAYELDASEAGRRRNAIKRKFGIPQRMLLGYDMRNQRAFAIAKNRERKR